MFTVWPRWGNCNLSAFRLLDWHDACMFLWQEYRRACVYAYRKWHAAIRNFCDSTFRIHSYYHDCQITNFKSSKKVPMYVFEMSIILADTLCSSCILSIHLEDSYVRRYPQHEIYIAAIIISSMSILYVSIIRYISHVPNGAKISNNVAMLRLKKRVCHQRWRRLFVRSNNAVPLVGRSDMDDFHIPDFGLLILPLAYRERIASMIMMYTSPANVWAMAHWNTDMFSDFTTEGRRRRSSLSHTAQMYEYTPRAWPRSELAWLRGEQTRALREESATSEPRVVLTWSTDSQIF